MKGVKGFQKGNTAGLSASQIAKAVGISLASASRIYRAGFAAKGSDHGQG
jgi:hypothetical protein